MSVLYLVVPLAFLFAGAAVTAFIWAVRQNQFEDLDTPAIRALFDENPSHETSDHPRVPE